MSSHPNTIESEGAVNLWMSVVEAAMCAVLVLATMIAAEQPQKAVEAGPDQEVVDVVQPEVSDQVPRANSPTGRGRVRPTHKLVALETQADQSPVIVIELDQPLPPEASVKFLINKQPSNPPQQ